MSSAPIASGSLAIAPHPLLDAAAFVTILPAPLGELASPPELLRFFDLGVRAPLVTDDTVKTAVRDLLRHGGFKPSGRSKPAAEYLIKAVGKSWLSPEGGINVAVDACNVVSLHSGLPISVLDAERAVPPYQLRLGTEGESYVFNPTGQVIDISGLLVLCDAEGPCGSPVKDSQRTKTHDATVRTLTVIWGTQALPNRTSRALDWYRELLDGLGAETRLLTLEATPQS